MQYVGNLIVKEYVLQKQIKKEIGLKHAKDLNLENQKYYVGFATSLFAINAVLLEQNYIRANPLQIGTLLDNLLLLELEQYQDLFNKDKALGLPPY